MTRKLPVVIAGTNCLSGVTTWADQLRTRLSDHPSFEVRLLYVGPGAFEDFDINVSSPDAAHQIIRELAPVILVPNYIWDLYLTGFEPGVLCLGICHADSHEQYYRPLSWFEPIISKFIAVSQECTERLTQQIPYRAEDITTLPYGIAVPHILHRNYQVNPLRLVYAGRVTQLQKRVWDFVPLVEHLVRAKLPFEFDIIGEGDHFETLQNGMLARVPPGCVRFQPRMPHSAMPEVWSGHDVFLQVSDFEGTSVSMLEAMAHGVVPVVTAASSGINGVIQHEKNGFVVPIGDMSAMTQILTHLAADRSLLATAGRAAHQTALAYSMDLYGGKFAQILDQMVEAGQTVDLAKRYGIHSPMHPLLTQRQVISQQQVQIAYLKQGAIKRFIKDGYHNIRPYMPKPVLNKLRNQFVDR